MRDYVSLPSLNILWGEAKQFLDYNYIVYVDEVANFSPDSVLINTKHPVKSIENFYKNIKLQIVLLKISQYKKLHIILRQMQQVIKQA